jgi:hypothetical protein
MNHKTFGRSDDALNEVPSLHLPEGTEENHKSINQVGSFRDRNSNQAPPKYECRALPLNSRAR